MFAVRLKEVRIVRGLSQTELANKISVAPSTICNLEKNKIKPTLRLLKQIALALNVTTDDLLNQEPVNFSTKRLGQENNNVSNEQVWMEYAKAAITFNGLLAIGLFIGKPKAEVDTKWAETADLMLSEHKKRWSK